MSLRALCIDANDPLTLARFWAAALRWDVGEEAGPEIPLVPTDGTSFSVVFLPVEEPKVARNRIHLDLTSATLCDQEETVSQLVALRARPIDVGQGPDDPHVVLADPEGNELCVIEPENSFLATCGRLGALACDGSRAVGCFWSEALGWPLVWDQDDETAIRAPDGTGPFITWGGGDLAPKVAADRLRLAIAPADDVDARVEVERLISLGATRGGEPMGPGGRLTMRDPDGNDFYVENAAAPAAHVRSRSLPSG